jgi:simple sugar transport system ATP-binding protein
LRRNEILGVAGVAGNGQRELCEAIVGLRPAASGSIEVNGRNMTGASPRSFIDSGVHYIPSDRKGVGMASEMDVQENSILRKYWSEPIAKGVLTDGREAGLFARRIVDDFAVATPSVHTPVKNLSGGNIQKLLMGRELSDSPLAVVVMHPTWGLDVAATRYVRERLLERREHGTAILLISEDLDELIALSDRLAVIFKGKFMGIIDEPESTPIEKIGLMMAGSELSEALG